MTEKELMLSEQLYIANDPELGEDNRKAKRLTHLINTASGEDREQIQVYFRELLEKTGENFWIEPPFHCDYGCHISVGENFYANYDCIILDVCEVNIGDNVFFGPRVSVYTAGHPIDAEVRNTQLEYGKKIKIGSNVWVGGNTVINPGVTIGDNVVIGSGYVVTKDLPSGVVAAGSPCKVIRPIKEKDHEYWKVLEEQYKKNKSL